MAGTWSGVVGLLLLVTVLTVRAENVEVEVTIRDAGQVEAGDLVYFTVEVKNGEHGDVTLQLGDDDGGAGAFRVLGESLRAVNDATDVRCPGVGSCAIFVRGKSSVSITGSALAPERVSQRTADVCLGARAVRKGRALASASACRPIGAAAEVRVSVDHNHARLGAGDVGRLQVVLDNTGARAAEDVEVEFPHLQDAHYLFDHMECNGCTMVRGALVPTLRLPALQGHSVFRAMVPVRVNDRLSHGADELGLQLAVTYAVGGDERQRVLSDDPKTREVSDATRLSLSAEPRVETTLRAVSGPRTTPGETIHWRAVVHNRGKRDAAGVHAWLQHDSALTVVPGSAQEAQCRGDECSIILEGKRVEDQRLVVRLGSLPAGSSRELHFATRVQNPFRGDARAVSAQLFVNHTRGLAILGSDDPETGLEGDPCLVDVDVTCVLRASNEVSLLFDNDGNDEVSPGDVLAYAITLENLGNADLLDVVYRTKADPNAKLVIGRTATTRGEVVHGNLYNDDETDCLVEVSVGDMTGLAEDGTSDTVVIKYAMTVGDNLEGYSIQVCNQGVVSGANFPETLSDDPATSVWDDPTCVTVASAAALKFTLEDGVGYDEDFDGIVDPGEVVHYTATISNTGNAADPDLVFSARPDPNTDLVPGSVTVSPQGTVVKGNHLADRSVEVRLGTVVGGGATIVVTFDARVREVLPDGVNEVSVQAVLTSPKYDPSIFKLVSADPDTAVVDDPTVTLVEATPHVTLSHAVSTAIVAPGGAFDYAVVVQNNGNQDALDAVVRVAVDARARVDPASVVTGGVVHVTDDAETGGQIVEVAYDVLPGGGGEESTALSLQVVDPFPNDADTSLAITASVHGANFDGSDEGESVAVVAVDTAPGLELFHLVRITAGGDGNGQAYAGDTLRYELLAVNSGTQTAEGVTISVTLDSSTELTVGSVESTNGGSVTSGNHDGDAVDRVEVYFPVLSGESGTGSVFFDAKIGYPLTAGVKTIETQGTLAFADSLVKSLDVATGLFGPTVVPMASSPLLTCTMVDAVEGDGEAQPGKEVTYTLEVRNAGDQDAAGVHIAAGAPDGSTFATGSVTTSAGTVATGNTVGDGTMVVELSLLGAGEALTVAYSVFVNDGTELVDPELTNQATVWGEGIDSIVSDDPRTNFVDDPTVTPVSFAPDVRVSYEFVGSVRRSGEPSGQASEVVITAENAGTQFAHGFEYEVRMGRAWRLTGHPVVSLGAVAVRQDKITVVEGHLGRLANGATLEIRLPAVLILGDEHVDEDDLDISFQAGARNTPGVRYDLVEYERPQNGVEREGRSAQLEQIVSSFSARIGRQVLVQRPTVEATTTVSLPSSGDGVVYPGQLLEYTTDLYITSGSAGRLGMMLSVVLDPLTELVEGTVESSAGSVMVGNTKKDNGIVINLGSATASGTEVQVRWTARASRNLEGTMILNREEAFLDLGLFGVLTLPDAINPPTLQGTFNGAGVLSPAFLLVVFLSLIWL